MAKRVITKLFVRDQEFHIIYHQNRYCAINTKYIDENGCITVELNGLQMHASETLNQCIETTRMSVEVKHMVDNGMPLEEAIMAYQRKEMVV